MVLFLLLHLLLGVDPLHLLLLTLDMTDGVSLWVVETGWSEEQTWQEEKSQSSLQTLFKQNSSVQSAVLEMVEAREGDIKHKMLPGGGEGDTEILMEK